MGSGANKIKRIYTALLRGINVGGHSVIKMSELKKMFEQIGFKDVATYIQSGNVIFSSNESTKEKIAQLIEKKFASLTGQETKAFVLSHEELRKAAANNPFDPARKEKEQICHLMFLSAKPDEAHIKALMKLRGEEYQFHVNSNVMYYAYPKIFAGKRRTIDFEKVLGVKGTSRTWKVVDKLIELSR